LDAVRDLLRAAESGGGGILLVQGERGSGRSRLLHQAAEIAGARGFSLIDLVVDELGRSTPFAPLLPMLAEAPVGPAEPAQAISWIAARLKEQALAAPVLVTIDDLQWADPDTLLAVRMLCRSLAASPLVWMLACYASGPETDAGRLLGLLESEGAARIDLEPMHPAAIEALLTGLLGVTPGPEVLELAAGAGGNPSLLTALATGLVKEDLLDLSGDEPRLTSAGLPRSVQAAIRLHLNALGAPARQLLDTAAVLGGSFSIDDAAAMLGMSPAALWPSLHEALEAGILTAVGDEMAFRQALVRQAILEALPEPVRTAIHRQAAQTVMERSGSAAAAADHLTEGARAGDMRTLRALDQAVTEIRSSAPQAAADLALRALELTEPGDPERPARTLNAVENYTLAGRLHLADTIAASALNRAMDGEAEARLHAARAQICYLGGRAVAAVAEATLALGAWAASEDGASRPKYRASGASAGRPARPLTSRSVRDEAESTRLLALTGLPDPLPAGKRATAILDDAESWGETALVAALLALSTARRYEGRLAEALTLAREAVRRTRSESVDAQRLHPRLVLAALLCDIGWLEEAAATVHTAQDEVEELGHGVWSSGPAVLRAGVLLVGGHADDAVAEAVSGLRTGESQGTHLFSAPALTVLGTSALRHGDLRGAQEFLADPRADLSSFGALGGNDRCALTRARIAESCGRPDDAMDLVAADLDALPGHCGILVGDLSAAAWLVRLALATGEPGRAKIVAATADQLARTNSGFPAVVAAAAHARGLLDRDARALERAVADHADHWARASAAEDLGRLLTEAGKERQAVRSLQTAVTGFEESGAPRDAARVRQRLRILGVRNRHWAAGAEGDRPVSGWESITDTELAVSELVAQGLTNQQTADRMFISVHTVAFHLRQVFRKLEIGSRVDLARLVLERHNR
jgi:DNA-binding CsgD family transcriptional regulator